jgi:hypothetical protein
MSEPSTDQLVRVFIRIRDARAKLSKEYETADQTLKDDLKQVEVELLRRAQQQGVEGFKTAEGTTYISEEVHVSIADPDSFMEFLEKADDPFMFYEQRPSLKRIKEFQAGNDGAIPPGIKMFRENRMRVRASK